MEKNKIAVLATLFIGMLLLISLGVHRSLSLPHPQSIDISGQPTIGSNGAKVEFVVFEDFRCHSCRRFSEEVFPKIETRYIDTGLIRYTLIPLAFIQGSKMVGNAALAVYASSPDRFFPFADELFAHFIDEEPDRNQILDLAKEVGGIDLEFLENSIRTRAFYPQLEKNLKLADEVMGDDFATPTLYINGIPTSTTSFEAVRARYERIVK